MSDIKNREFGEHFMSDDGWRTSFFSDEDKKIFLDKWYTDKEYLGEDEKFITYVCTNKEWDEEEQEFWYLIRTLIRVGKNSNVIMTKRVTETPLFRVRDEKLTRNQEIMVRSWCGTDKKPKGGKYLGVNDIGLAMVKSPHSGNTIYFNKEGKHTDEKGNVQTFEKNRYVKTFEMFLR